MNDELLAARFEENRAHLRTVTGIDILADPAELARLAPVPVP